MSDTDKYAPLERKPKKKTGQLDDGKTLKKLGKLSNIKISENTNTDLRFSKDFKV